VNEIENNILRAAATQNPSVTKFFIHIYYSDLRRAPELKKYTSEKQTGQRSLHVLNGFVIAILHMLNVQKIGFK
jgi:hypothetical protein